MSKKRLTRAQKIQQAKDELRAAEKGVERHEDGWLSDSYEKRTTEFGIRANRNLLKEERQKQNEIVEQLTNGSLERDANGRITDKAFLAKMQENEDNIRRHEKAIRDAQNDRRKREASAKARLNAAKKALKKAEEPLEFLKTDPQAFLLYNMGAFTSVRKPSQIAHSNYFVASGDSVFARHHLLSIQGAEKLMNIETKYLSSLVPRVRLFKVTPHKPPKEIEILFDDFQEPIKTMTQSRDQRCTGAGLKSISMDFTGQSTADARTRVEISMQLYFTSLDEMFRERNSGNGKFRYSDLITPTSGMVNLKPGENIRDIGYQRLKMSVGYSIPQGDLWKNQGDLKDVLRRAHRTLFLNLSQHEVDFAENGTVSLTIKFHGYIEKQMVKTDILELSLTKKDRDLLRQGESELFQMQNPRKPSRNPCAPPAKRSSEEQKKEKNERIKEIKDNNAKLRTKAYSSFMQRLFRGKKVNVCHFKELEVDGLRLLNPAQSIGTTAEAQFAKKLEQAKKRKKGENGVDEKDGTYKIEYFYLGDLLDEILYIAREHPSMKNFDFCFGECPYRDRLTNKPTSVEIARLPISVSSFSKWFNDHVIRKGERTSYNLRSFLMDLLTNLVSSMFRATVFGDEDRQLGQGSVVPSFSLSTFNTKNSYQGKWINYKKITNINPQTESSIYINNYIYGSSAFVETRRVTKNEAQDAKRGVYHLVAAREHGLVKRLKFKREDNETLRAARLTSNGRGKLGQNYGILADLYNADIEMFGNPIFFPGMQVYVKTLAYNVAAAEKIQLVGYYRVLKVSSTIENGDYKTDIQCQYEHSGNVRGDCS